MAEADPPLDQTWVPETPLLDALHQPISDKEMDWIATTYFAFHPFLGHEKVDTDDAPAETQQLSSEILDLVAYNPDRAWPIVVELVDRAPNDDILGWVAAGLVEYMVIEHGSRFVDQLENRARQSARFRRALAGIYWTRVRPEVEARLMPFAKLEWGERRD